MKYAITDLTYEQMNVATAALNDAGAPTADTAIETVTPPAETVTVSGTTTGLDGTYPVNTPPVEAGVVLDKTGCPWDARIHAKTQTQKADGSWKSAATKHLTEQNITKDG